MTDSHNSTSCCSRRYIERLDHDALIKRLNEIADELYTLTQMCSDLDDRLAEHDASSDAHRTLRELINAATARIATIKTTIDASLETLENRVDSNYSTLVAADAQLANRLDNVDAELEALSQDIGSFTLNLNDSITSTVDGTTPIIKSIADSDNVILAELPSTHGKFNISTDGDRSIVTYTATNNTSGIPNHTVILLDEGGDTVFPGSVTASALHGNADTATLADKATKLNTPINIVLKDASGENTGSSVSTDLSSNITLKVPSVLKGTDITGTANKAHNDATGADIPSTYVHKTGVNEEIDGVKTFNDVLKGSSIEPKTHSGSTIGTAAVPYEDIHSTNIHGVNADIANITGNVTGNASTATKLATARKINGTDFNGTSAIVTKQWGTSRGISIIDASSTNIGTAVQVDGSADAALKLPSTIKATLTGNASTASKLATARKINGTTFDGSGDITTTTWGTTRSMAISDSTGEHTGTSQNVNGSANVTLKLPSNITATNFYGNASTATKLNRAITINGTTFDGSANITTTAWGYSRNVQITDNDASHLGEITSVNGTSDITLKLPSTIKATLDGTATSATQFSANTTVTLTGDATGTSAGSKKGWTVPVTLANSGVTAGTYGSTASSNLATNSDPINIPVITVDAKGRVTRVVNEQHTYTSTVYSANKGIKLTGSTFGLDSSYTDSSTQRYVTGGNLSGNVLHLKTKDFKIDTYGRITSNTTNTDITVDLTSIIPTIADATTTSKGVVQIGDNLDVANGIVSVADTVLKSDKTQNFDNESLLKLMSNLGIINVNSVGSWLQHSINFSDLVIQYGNSLLAESIPGDSNRKVCTVCYREPVTSTSNFAIGSPLSSYPDGDQCCSVITDSYGPRSMLMGLGDVNQSSRVRYLAINYKFPINENKYVATPETTSRSSYPSNYTDGMCITENWSGTVWYSLSKGKAGYTSFNHVNPVFLVDMFMSANAPSSDYIEFDLESSTIGNSDTVSIFGKSRLSNTVNIRQDGSRKYFSRGYDINLANGASGDNNNTALTMLGYKDRTNRKLIQDSLFNTFIMSSFTLTITDTTNFFQGTSYFRLAFNKSFSSGVKGYIRIFYLGNG